MSRSIDPCGEARDGTNFKVMVQVDRLSQKAVG